MQILLLLFMLLCSACAPKHSPVVLPELPEAPEAQAQAVWQRFLQTPPPFTPAAPFRLTTSLRYSTPQDGHRVVLRMWGNGTDHIRLDLETGIGTLVARIESSTNGFTAYSPAEKQAVVHPRSQDALMRLGVPVPLSVRQVMYLLQGQYKAVFGSSYQRAALVGSTTLAYTLAPESIGGTLHLTPEGQPILWEQAANSKAQNGGWRIEFSRYTPEGIAGKIAFRYRDSHKALFLYKNGSTLQTPFTAEQLKLVLPPGTATKPLRRMKQDG